jgi:hypothetical protein
MSSNFFTRHIFFLNVMSFPSTLSVAVQADADHGQGAAQGGGGSGSRHQSVAGGGKADESAAFNVAAERVIQILDEEYVEMKVSGYYWLFLFISGLLNRWFFVAPSVSLSLSLSFSLSSSTLSEILFLMFSFFQTPIHRRRPSGSRTTRTRWARGWRS